MNPDATRSEDLASPLTFPPASEPEALLLYLQSCFVSFAVPPNSQQEVMAAATRGVRLLDLLAKARLQDGDGIVSVQARSFERSFLVEMSSAVRLREGFTSLGDDLTTLDSLLSDLLVRTEELQVVSSEEGTVVRLSLGVGG